ARAADTIADTRLIPTQERIHCLDLLAGPFQGLRKPSEVLLKILRNVPRHQNPSAENKLLEHLSACFEFLSRLSASEQDLIKEVVTGVIQ
ncbi:MAG: farnesyl-diphosphate farnesyltransferase, partial [Elusimicrobia bacterium]|nr:farnesyl-diphosphate farnesyltransferase [Elusimicrobiota bacterium]